MKKLTKTLTALLLAGTTLSLMCGCDNGATDDKNSSVSDGNSTTQSITDKSGTSSKEEKQQEEKIEKLKQLPLGATVADARKIIEDEPHDVYELYEIYYVGKYDVFIFDSDKYILGHNVYVQDIETQEWTNIVYDGEIFNPYDKNNGNYPDAVKELVKKLSPITQSSTREDVIKILGEPSETSSYMGVTHDTFKVGEVEVYATYFGKGFTIGIHSEKRELPYFEGNHFVQVVYPESFPIKKDDEELSGESNSSSPESSDNQTPTIDWDGTIKNDSRTILKLNDERRNKIYDEKIEKLKQLPEDATFDDVEIVLDTPPGFSFGSGVSHDYYYLGKYIVYIMSFSDCYVYNNETGESVNILYHTEPYKPYNEKGNYSKEVKDFAEKLTSITVDSTREDVIKALGEPDETDIEEPKAVHTDTFNGDKYKIEVTYHGKGLLADIRFKDGRLFANVVYPDRYKNKNNNSSQGEN